MERWGNINNNHATSPHTLTVGQATGLAGIGQAARPIVEAARGRECSGLFQLYSQNMDTEGGGGVVACLA